MPTPIKEITPMNLEQLRARLVEINARLVEMRDDADHENRPFSNEETTEVNALCDERDATQQQIAAAERVTAALANPPNPNPGRRTTAGAGDDPPPAAGSPPRITPITTPLQRDRGGFHTFGDYLQAVMGASARGGRIDQRLLANAPTTYATEGSGPDGGFSVPPDYRTAIMELIESEDTLFGRTDQQTSSSNTFVFNTDETAPWSTAGIQAYWVGEGGQLTESKPVMKQNSMTLHKLAVMVSVTEELAADSASLDRWIRSKAPAKIAYELDRVLIHGTGAGQPLGVLNAPALVSVAKESGQTADTVVVANLVNMWSRCYAPRRQSAVWLINQDVEPQLLQLMMEGTSSSWPVYLPAGGFSQAPYGTLFGRPVIPTQICETLGDKGDIFLCDFGSYLTVTRAMRQDTSIHLYFDYDVMAFRFILRVAGQPSWSTTLSARDGSATYSPFVTLDERT
jgi:HK97 family phage major capsid protein